MTEHAIELAADRGLSDEFVCGRGARPAGAPSPPGYWLQPRSISTTRPLLRCPSARGMDNATTKRSRGRQPLYSSRGSSQAGRSRRRPRHRLQRRHARAVLSRGVRVHGPGDPAGATTCERTGCDRSVSIDGVTESTASLLTVEDLPARQWPPLVHLRNRPPIWLYAAIRAASGPAFRGTESSRRFEATARRAACGTAALRLRPLNMPRALESLARTACRAVRAQARSRPK
jgi:hypothetical protein